MDRKKSARVGWWIFFLCLPVATLAILFAATIQGN
jgi:hypothetical protein